MTGLNEALLRAGVKSDDMDKATAYLQRAGGAIEQVLVNMGALSEDQLPELYSDALGDPIFDEAALENWTPSDGGFSTLQLAFLTEKGWLPLEFDKTNALVCVTCTPLDLEVLEYFAGAKVRVKRQISSRDVFDRMLAHFQTNLIDPVGAEVGQLSATEEDRLRELASEAPTVNLLNRIITRALKMRASDIHIEPSERSVLVRFRIDGVLQDAESVSLRLQLPLVSRVKILAGMDIAERRRPQDGKIELRIANTDLDIRVSVLPLHEGESVVMRLLRKDSITYSFEELDLLSDTKSAIQADLAKTTGVILMTGPTGSGKTTSLYTFLGHLNKPGVKIITLEDPVEYQLAGLNQVQVRPEIDFDFSAGLRSIVRQDPDVIMVGEIRDEETCKIALQAALTGHLVFSTVHTNDAASAFTRLLDLGVPEYLLNAALLSVMAQRLVRRLCPDCSASADTPADLIAEHQLEGLVERFEFDEPNLRKPVGCDACSFTGYRGRIAILEYLQVDDRLKAIPKDDQFLTQARQLSAQRGFRSLMEDGMLRALRGETTVEEVTRVCG